MDQQTDTPQTAPQNSQEEAIRRLTAEVERFNNHRFIAVQNSRWRLLGFQFMRGLAFGLGSVIGASLLVSMIGWWLSQFEFLPLIGDWMVILSDEFERAGGTSTGN
ncbi:DUF5665 domain-containing protein [Phaeobacter sp. CNT1-3]|nr:DUF5665 domain-containing protein [Phaeobacter sp. CNT1-3]